MIRRRKRINEKQFTNLKNMINSKITQYEVKNQYVERMIEQTMGYFKPQFVVHQGQKGKDDYVVGNFKT